MHFFNRERPEPVAEPIPDTPIKQVIFEGGSVKGTAYAGAWAALARTQDLRGITKVAGTSAGGIAAVLTAVNYSPEDLTRLLNTDFRQFLDDRNQGFREAMFSITALQDGVTSSKVINASQHSKTLLSGVPSQLSQELGLFDGCFLRDWLDELIFHQTKVRHCTFAELAAQPPGYYFRELTLVGFNLNTREPIIFNHHNTPNVVIADAARISLGIPLIFVPHPIIEKTGAGLMLQAPVSLCVDGGVAMNYPIEVFDSKNPQGVRDFNPHTLGFRLSKADKIAALADGGKGTLHQPIEGIKGYVGAIVSSLLSFQDWQHEDCPGDRERTVYIDTLGVDTLDFDLDEQAKQQLIQSGWDAVCTRFDLQDTALPPFLKITDEPAAAEHHPS